MKIAQIVPERIDESRDSESLDAVLAYDDEEFVPDSTQTSARKNALKFLKHHDPALYKKIKSLS